MTFSVLKLQQIFYTINISRLSKFVTVFFSAGAIVSICSSLPTLWKCFIAALTTLASTLELVLGLTESIRKHSEFKRQYAQIVYKVAIHGWEKLTKEEAQNYKANIKKIEISEPSPIHILLDMARNQFIRVEKDCCADVKETPISKWKYRFCWLINFEGEDDIA